MKQPTLPCPTHTCWSRMRVSVSLCRWYLQLGTYSVGFFFFFSPPRLLPSESKAPHRHVCERVSYCVQSSLRLPPQDGSPSLNLLSLFSFSILCPTSFWRDWAAFLGVWCPPPAYRVVLWKSFNIQMIFWWICGWETGLPILLLHHLGTVPGVFNSFIF